MRVLLKEILASVRGSIRDVLPIVLVVAFFEIVVLRQPVPNLGRILRGSLMAVLGLALFIRGLEMGLCPLGEDMADGFVRKGSLGWLLVFAFLLGFGTTAAEPALTAIADEAAEVAAGAGVVAYDDSARDAYAVGLRFKVALSVGLAIIVGVSGSSRAGPSST